MNYQRVCLEAVAYSLPEQIVTSEELEARLRPLYERLGLVPGRLELMSGIRERRFWPEGMLPSEASAQAGRNALAKAGIPAAQVDCLIHCSVSRDFVEPATSTAVHRLLGLREHVMNFDISNACLGMATGVLMLANMVELGQIEVGLAVCGENSGPLVRNTIATLNSDMSMTRKRMKGQFASLTIGSCGAAVVVRRADSSQSGHRLIGAANYTDTSASKLCQGDANGGMTEGSAPLMETDSQALLLRGVEAASRMWKGLKEVTGWEERTPDVFCTHQVGKAHSALLFQSLGLDQSRDFVTYPFLGNCGSASWPATCAMAEREGVLRKNQKLAILAIGSGINCTGLAVEW